MYTIYIRTLNHNYKTIHFIDFDLAFDAFVSVQMATDFDNVDMLDGLTRELLATADRNTVRYFGELAEQFAELIED